jgi:DNA-binding winged helix-turn-helix (wHTH) protein/TolB-like protein
MTAETQSRAIDLAHEAAFTLGSMKVRPAALEVQFDGHRALLEPRVMQVLALLAAARGEVVSRDDLIAACWAGRVVGDDAINRCIGRLRKLASSNGAFTIETVPRVGFRLVAVEAGDAPRAQRWPRPRVIVGAVAAAAAIVLILAGVLWSAFAGRAAREPSIAVTPFQALTADAESRAFATRLSDSVTGMVTENVGGLTLFEAGAGRRRPDIVLGGTVSREDRSWRVRLYANDQVSGARLWSGEFSRPVQDEASLRDEVSVAATRTVSDATEPLATEGLRLDPRSLALFIKAREANQNRLQANHGDARRAWEELVAREPDFVNARATWALAMVNDSLDAPPQERAQLQRRGREEAVRAIGMNPAAAGSAYDALARLVPPQAVGKREALLLQGLSKGPDFPFLNMRECQLLLEVGRAGEAFGYCERALALRPMAPQIGHSYVRALYARGSTERAHNAIQKIARFHPNHVPTRAIRFDLAAFGGYDGEARAILANPGLRPVEVAEEGVPAMLLFLRARKTRTVSDIDRALAALDLASRRGSVDRSYYVLAAADLGRHDLAFEALEEPVAQGYARYFLLTPPAAPLWRDPRFWRASQRLGFVDYWRQSGHWPDFCSEPAFSVDCPKAAARVAGT